jgi:hypothetical protein
MIQITDLSRQLLISHADRHADPLIFFLIVKVSPPDTTVHLIVGRVTSMKAIQAPVINIQRKKSNLKVI